MKFRRFKEKGKVVIGPVKESSTDDHALFYHCAFGHYIEESMFDFAGRLIMIHGGTLEGIEVDETKEG